MAELRAMIRFILFFSGYFPLFIILDLLKYGDINATATSVFNGSLPTNPVGLLLGFLTIFSIFSIIITHHLLIIPSNYDNFDEFYPISVTNENASHLNYLMTYVLPILTINIDSLNVYVYYEITAFLVILAIIYIIYSKSNLIHSNIVFLLLGYNLFRIQNNRGDEIFVLSKKRDLFINIPIYLYPVNSLRDGFFVVS